MSRLRPSFHLDEHRVSWVRLPVGQAGAMPKCWALVLHIVDSYLVPACEDVRSCVGEASLSSLPILLLQIGGLAISASTSRVRHPWAGIVSWPGDVAEAFMADDRPLCDGQLLQMGVNCPSSSFSRPNTSVLQPSSPTDFPLTRPNLLDSRRNAVYPHLQAYQAFASTARFRLST